MAQIAVDIDSTLYDFETPARDAFMQLARAPRHLGEIRGPDYQRGAYHPWQEWRSPADACGLEAWLEVIKMVHAPEVILSRRPFPGAVETCQALANAGHKLLYISARDHACVQPTLTWIAKSGFPSGDPHKVCCVQGDKREYMVECQYLIDDRPKTVIEFIHDSGWKHYRAVNRTWVDAIRKEAGDEAVRGAVVEPRLAFVKAYLYNQNLSDIPNVYVAPTWDAIRFYLEKKGVL